MYFKTIALSVVCLSSLAIVGNTQQQNNEQQIQQVRKCACGPTEHWLYACCVARYNIEYPEAQLVENKNTEDLADNIVQAIAMLAATVPFVDDQGNVILPEVTAKGNRIIFLSKNAYYKACKALMHNLDESTTLPAEELYAMWIAELTKM